MIHFHSDPLLTEEIRFYAPWCGHCKNLQPAYEKAAQNLKGLAKVAAIDCDDDANKPFCGSMGVQGFPTLKIVKPGKKPGKPIVEDYQGARSAKAIVDAVVEKIPNHVKRVTDKSLDGWLKEGGAGAKAILFSDKGTTSALLKALAVDYLGSVSVAQIRDKEQSAVEKYGITSFPTFVVLPAGSEDPVVYTGDLKKEAMSKFISEATSTSPNPDPAPEAPKKAKAKKEKPAAKKSEKLKATEASLEDEPTASPDPKVDAAKPIEVPDVAPAALPTLETEADLQSKCLSPKSKICILALLPKPSDPDAVLSAPATEALQSLAEVSHKLAKRGAGAFPFYAVPAENPLAAAMRAEIGLKDEAELELIATNAKRAWVRKYAGAEFGTKEIGEWVDAIRMNEGTKETLPAVLLGKETEDEPPKVVFDGPITDGGPIVDGPIVVEMMQELDDDYELPKADIKDEL